MTTADIPIRRPLKRSWIKDLPSTKKVAKYQEKY